MKNIETEQKGTQKENWYNMTTLGKVEQWNENLFNCGDEYRVQVLLCP